MQSVISMIYYWFFGLSDLNTSKKMKPHWECYHTIKRGRDIFRTISIDKIVGKSSVEECIFYYIELQFECIFNKNSLLQRYFLVFLPVGHSTTIVNTLRGRVNSIPTQPAKSLKSNTGGGSFCWIGIQYAVPYTQKYTPPHCFFCNFARGEYHHSR